MTRSSITTRMFEALSGRSLAPFGWLFAKYRLSIPAVAALGVVASLLEGIGIGLLIPLLGLLLATDLPQGMPSVIQTLAELTSRFDRQSRIVLLGLAVMTFIIFKGIVQGANQAFIANLHGRIARDMRIALCTRVLTLDYSFFLKNDRSRIVQIVASNSWYASESLRSVLTAIPAAMALAIFSALLIYIDIRLGLFAISGALLIQLLLVAVERRQRSLSKLVTPADHALGERTLSLIMAIRSIKIFGQEGREIEDYSVGAEELRRCSDRVERVSAFALPASDILVSCLFVAILLLSISFGVSLPVATAFVVLLLRAMPYGQTISRARIQIAANSGPTGQVQWLLAQEPAERSHIGEKPVPVIDQSVRFADVSYDYPDGNPALRDVCLQIRHGVATALIGDSGSGKTTVVNLLARLVEPTSGTLWHGTHRLDELSPIQWRSHIAIAGQNIDLLQGTMAENIAYSRPDAPREEVEEIAHISGAMEFISKLPEGLDTHLDLNAFNLSGGQRQRIGLARALIANPDLLILDEATNEVDALTESEIFRLLANHRYFRTALVIGHRKKTLVACEDGIVIKHGRVVEAGPLASLSYYQQMA